MIFLAALIGTLLWLFLLALMIYARQTPKARTQHRMEQMIREAEEQRAAVARQRERIAPVDLADVKEHRSFSDTPFRERVLRPLLKSLEDGLSRMAPKELYGMLEQQIFLAGKQDQWSVKRLAACWILSVALGGLLGLALLRLFPELLWPQEIALVLLCVAGGAAIPFLFLQSTIQKRKRTIRRQLPEFLDLLCVSVQAGLSFDGAVSKMIGRMKGPLVEEFRRMQRDMGLGMVRSRSLAQLARRCDIEEVYLFTTSVVQAERLGTSMAKTLKVQADNMRDRHRQHVRAEAMKAPVKILFPMLVFIFPAIFVIVLFPSLLALLRSMGG